MSSLFSKIFLQAEKTFALANKDSIKSNLALLIRLVDSLELKDLAIDPHFVSEKAFQGRTKAPCTFINICERENFTMSVFILSGSYTMPLHDHPKMKGILKVISGKLKIQSYTKISNSEDLVTPDHPVTLDQSSPASFLDEKCSNFHEITAVNKPVAFFDVLSPPYSDLSEENPESRHCHFFRKLMVDNSSEKKVLKLEQIPCPNHYYCDNLQYDKPDFMNS